MAFGFYEGKAAGLLVWYFLEITVTSDIRIASTLCGKRMTRLTGYHRMLRKRFPVASIIDLHSYEIELGVLDCRRDQRWLKPR